MGLGCGVARRGLEADLTPLEDEVLLARLVRVRARVRARVGVGVRGLLARHQRDAHGQQLLRHHGEHLDVDPVELVEARPASALDDTAEELAHHLVVELVRAVEDDALAADAFGEVLDALGLARARGAGRRAAQTHVQRA